MANKVNKSRKLDKKDHALIDNAVRGVKLVVGAAASVVAIVRIAKTVISSAIRKS